MEDDIKEQAIGKKLEVKLSGKQKIYFATVAIILIAGAYIYYWYQKNETLRIQSSAVIEQAKGFDELRGAIEDERDRCEKFIIQNNGDFSSYEYCKKYIDWAQGLPLSK